MKKKVLLGALVWAMAASPGSAYSINLNGGYIPEFGQFEILEYLSYAPYALKVINGQTYAANDEEPGYFLGEAWTSVEMGLGQDVSANVIVPYDIWRQFDGQDGAIGLYDLSLGLSRRLFEREGHAGRLRLRVDLATGNAERDLGAGVPGLGVEHASEHRLADGLTAYVNANYFYRLRRTTVDGEGRFMTSWQGQRVELHTGLEWSPSESLSFIVEQLGTWQEGGHEQRQALPESGSWLLQVAPGVTWTVSEQVALQASVLVPVMRRGYQDAYVWSGMVGTVLNF